MAERTIVGVAIEEVEAWLIADHEALKRVLAAKHRAHREAYTDGKAPFIRSVLERARAL